MVRVDSKFPVYFIVFKQHSVIYKKHFMIKNNDTKTYLLRQQQCNVELYMWLDTDPNPVRCAFY